MPMRLAAGDELNRTVAACPEPCRSGEGPLPDLVGVHAGEKGLLWVGEPSGALTAEAAGETRFPFYHLAHQTARLAGVSEDELVFCAFPHCQPTRGLEGGREEAVRRCRRHLERRLRLTKTPPTVIAVGRVALVETLATVREIAGQEPALAPLGLEDGAADRSAAGAWMERMGRFYFQAAEFRVVPLPAALASPGGDPGPTGRLLAEFAGNVGRLCRSTLCDRALARVRELVPLAFREKMDASGSTYFTPANHRLFRVVRRPRELVAEFYPPSGGTCYVYRGTDVDHFLEMVVDILTQAIG
jgi:uracil-DNA glycosylase